MNNIIKQAEALFERAAVVWERGNNGLTVTGHACHTYQKAENLAACNAFVANLHAEAEALLAPLGIVVDYPGLYPCFKVAGREYIDLASAVAVGWACSSRLV